MTEQLERTSDLARKIFLARLNAYWRNQGEGSVPQDIQKAELAKWYKEALAMAKAIAHEEEAL